MPATSLTRYLILDYWTLEAETRGSHFSRLLKQHLSKLTPSPKVEIIRLINTPHQPYKCPYHTPLARMLIKKHLITQTDCLIAYGLTSSHIAQEIASLTPVSALFLQEICNDPRSEIPSRAMSRQGLTESNCPLIQVYVYKDSPRPNSISFLHSGKTIFTFQVEFVARGLHAFTSFETYCTYCSFEQSYLPKIVAQLGPQYLNKQLEKRAHSDHPSFVY